MAGYIYDLAQLIHQQHLAPVRIVAHSLGGNIALRYAGIYPENVRRLVAIEGLGPGPNRTSRPSANRSPSGCAAGSRSSARWPAAQPRRYADGGGRA